MFTETEIEKEPLMPKNNEAFDLIIIGAGPAGMSAALCASRAMLKTLLIDKTPPGGEMSTAYKVSNYLGFPNGILGVDLAEQMETQLFDYNVSYCCESVENILNIKESEKVVKTELGNTYKTRAIILATGLEPKCIDADFEKKFLGRGISYYAQGDGASYKGKNVAVIGGGNCACYAAEHLSQFVNKLYLIHRSDDIKAVKLLKERILNNSKIDIIWNTEPIDAFGLEKLEKLKLLNIVTKQHTWIDVKGVFVYIGRIPPKEILTLDIDLDEEGFVITDEYMRTNIPGVYAAGDIRAKQIRQIATAVSDGMIAAINADKDFNRL